MRAYPFSSSISIIIPLRRLSLLITVPSYSSGTIATTSSTGSIFTPFSSLCRMTSGLDTASSYPSLRIFSISTEIWSSPLPLTLKQSADSVGSTFRPTLTSSSFSKRSFRLRDVTYFPLWPAKGLLLTWKFMLNVGSSISMLGRGRMWSFTQRVSPIEISAMPATTTISPLWASSTLTLVNPL